MSKDINNKTEKKQWTLCGVGLSAFKPDIENWGLGTYVYAYILYWCTFVGLINLAYYLFY